MKRPLIVIFLLSLSILGRAGFPLWLDSPAGRDNQNDPRSPGFSASTPALQATATASPSQTLTGTATETATISATLTASGTATLTGTITQTATISATLTVSATLTATPSITLTSTPSASPSATSTMTQSPTFTQTVGPRGATLPYVEYEAENGLTNGVLLGPNRVIGQVAAESSGRTAVQLNATGHYLSITAIAAANSIVVRYVIPDAPAGNGINATISLYIDGVFDRKLNLTSKYSWNYNGWNYPYSKNPATGGAFHFYDEARSLCSPISAGSVVTLQKDAGDTAAYYTIDLIDLEQVAPALSMPANYLDITAYGATANDGTDDSTAIQNCINDAMLQGKGVWIPVGTFKSLSAPFNGLSNVTVRGAGMWYSTISGFYARFNLNGSNCQFYDFAILGETINRDDASPENGFNNKAGTGSRLQNIWIEHTKCGYWVGNGGAAPVSNGLVITGCRIRNTYADGVNFCNGTSNSTVTNCHFRNTGDDSIASWSPAASGINSNNLFSFNTVQSPWRANCFAIYGGTGNRIEDNLGSDTLDYPGILIGQEFNSRPFGGTTSVQRNTLTRCGGLMWGVQQGALKISALDANMSGFLFKDLQILNSTYSGIHFAGPKSVNTGTFSNINISAPATWGILVASGMSGSVNLDTVAVSAAGFGGSQNNSSGTFSLVKISGNVGW